MKFLTAATAEVGKWYANPKGTKIKVLSFDAATGSYLTETERGVKVPVLGTYTLQELPEAPAPAKPAGVRTLVGLTRDQLVPRLPELSDAELEELCAADTRAWLDHEVSTLLASRASSPAPVAVPVQVETPPETPKASGPSATDLEWAKGAGKAARARPGTVANPYKAESPLHAAWAEGYGAAAPDESPTSATDAPARPTLTVVSTPPAEPVAVQVEGTAAKPDRSAAYLLGREAFACGKYGSAGEALLDYDTIDGKRRPAFELGWTEAEEASVRGEVVATKPESPLARAVASVAPSIKAVLSSDVTAGAAETTARERETHDIRSIEMHIGGRRIEGIGETVAVAVNFGPGSDGANTADMMAAEMLATVEATGASIETVGSAMADALGLPPVAVANGVDETAAPITEPSHPAPAAQVEPAPEADHRVDENAPSPSQSSTPSGLCGALHPSTGIACTEQPGHAWSHGYTPIDSRARVGWALSDDETAAARAAAARPVVEPAATPSADAKARGPRGFCPVCGKEGERIKDGSIRSHQVPSDLVSAELSGKCPGSGQRALDAAPAKAEPWMALLINDLDSPTLVDPMSIRKGDRFQKARTDGSLFDATEVHLALFDARMVRGQPYVTCETTWETPGSAQESQDVSSPTDPAPSAEPTENHPEESAANADRAEVVPDPAIDPVSAPQDDPPVVSEAGPELPPEAIRALVGTVRESAAALAGCYDLEVLHAALAWELAHQDRPTVVSRLKERAERIESGTAKPRSIVTTLPTQRVAPAPTPEMGKPSGDEIATALNALTKLVWSAAMVGVRVEIHITPDPSLKS